MQEKKRLNLDLPKELHHELRKRVAVDDFDIKSIIEIGIEAYLKQPEMYVGVCSSIVGRPPRKHRGA